MFGFKKKRELKSGTINKETSYMMAVPKSEDEIKNPKDVIDRLKETTLFNFKGAEMKENLIIKVEYKGEEYEVELIPEDVVINQMYTINHQLTEENYNAMMNAECGLTTAMVFGESSIDSYHLQLKILYVTVPNMVAIVDFCTERVLSGVWAKITAESKIPPSYDYIYSIQAISDEDGGVWLHTHGLNRCGSIEVEILQSNKDTYKNHYYILQTIAKRVISDGGFVDEEEAFWIGRMNNGESLVATWISWTIATSLYKNKDILGGIKDRVEGHKFNTGVVYIYLSEEDYKKRKYTHVSAVDEEISDNLLMMFTTEETIHMSSLAKERIKYFRDAINNAENEIHGLMKMGLLVDEEYQNEEKDNREHIWFEVIEINDTKIRGILTQEPYYIKNLEVNSEMELAIEDLTDWILYTPDNQITPDSVYLL
ncbi:DUF4026 domain-containing protein [Clostridium sp. C2-6-12]|uniref:DUF4026 domain-containing protein n=1 Tax=Clostridium sp. C2-6-12 TaxID=2698832 RepID=UPI00136F1492|nr:DUF4026 domain-containing protein [Clostridium sp. C2-6-12]